MLTFFRRHLEKCRFTSRRDRNCRCPIHVEGKLNGTMIRRKLETSDWNTASAIIHRWERQQYIGPEREDVDPGITVTEAIDSYLNDCTARHLSPLTMRKYRATLLGNTAKRNQRKDITPTPPLATWCQEKGIEYVSGLTLNMLRQYRAEWKDSALTASKRLEYLRGWWKFCAATKAVEMATFEALHPPKVRPNQKQPFTIEEMKRILEACDKRPRAKQLRALVLLMRYSGHRIQAAVTCACERLDGDRLFLYAQKSGAPVRTVLPAVAVDALRECPRATPTHWFSYGAAGETDAGHWSRRLKKVFEEAGIKDGHSHRFRHTFAVSMLQEGVSVAEVAVLLGNSAAVVEKHYSAWVLSRQDRLEAALRRMHANDPLAAAPERKIVNIRG